ncbi:hypothetical protein Ccrd_005581 [Cynara cardunculus var. scolymus]|uniref:Uncharacterized protein n=1 Tax=Cynara cardunculus var. scolymus TaxID=59895 RepID=A0A103XKK5_CYNCS|nr:hypothetical protein Ccrd_005581 [Cynara cardunculus var. scolymus]
MKRKKWSELEEQTLLAKYSDLHNSGTLAKLKTREKKFKPIAEHVNSVHHLRDPMNFPFKWSWRDVSIKVQNMRHQYLGVKQKIRVSDSEYNWKDGENHWENFMKYKEVFGDIELESKDNKRCNDLGDDVFGDSGYGYSRNGGDEYFGFGFEELQNDEEEDDGNGELGGGNDDTAAIDTELGVEKEDESDDSGSVHVKKLRKGIGGRMIGLVGAQMMELRDVVMRREEKRREREWRREEGVLEREERKREREKKGREREEEGKIQELEYEDRQLVWARRESESRMRLEMEVEEERQRRMAVEEKWEEEEMNWREKMVRMQMEHEKQMMQLHANACQNQMQILGVMARFFCQFLGSASDGLGTLGPQVLQHPGGLDENGKPDANSPSEFL